MVAASNEPNYLRCSKSQTGWQVVYQEWNIVSSITGLFTSVWIWIEYPDKPEEYGVNCSVSDDSFTNGNDQLQDIVSLIQKEVKYVNIMTGA